MIQRNSATAAVHSQCVRAITPPAGAVPPCAHLCSRASDDQQMLAPGLQSPSQERTKGSGPGC